MTPPLRRPAFSESLEKITTGLAEIRIRDQERETMILAIRYVLYTYPPKATEDGMEMLEQSIPADRRGPGGAA